MRLALPLRPTRAIPAAVALAALAGRAAAQGVPNDNAPAAAASDARWQAWYGCWSAAPDSAEGAGAGLRGESAVTCVTPAGGSAVEVTTVAGGKVAARDRLDASGVQRRFDRDGCTGWEKGEWAADGRRVYLRTELACANNVRRTGDGVLAFTRAGEWLDVRGATVGGYTGVRTVRYRPALEPSGLPAEVAAALKGRSLGVETARAAVSGPATTADVVEVTRRAGAPVAAAWVAELRQRFAIDARQLAALANAGVPGSVTDVLVATTFPQRFALGPSGAERTLRESRDANDARGRPGPVAVLMSPMYGGWGWDGLGFGPFGYNTLGYNALGYNAWNTGYYPRGGYWGTGPVVIVRPGPTAGGDRPRIVPGRGYSQGDNASSGSARPSGSAPSRGWGSEPAVSRGGYSGATTSSGGAASTSGSSAGGSSSTSSDGGGRTAKPRP